MVHDRPFVVASDWHLISTIPRYAIIVLVCKDECEQATASLEKRTTEQCPGEMRNPSFHAAWFLWPKTAVEKLGEECKMGCGRFSHGPATDRLRATPIAL